MELEYFRSGKRTFFLVARGLVAGTFASVLSVGVLLIAGKRDAKSAVAPINAVSHWLWGREALQQQSLDLKHTLLGYTIHHGASIFWGMILTTFLHCNSRLETTRGVTAASAATSAIACFIDFQLTPQRLTPGFEHRLSKKSLAATYVVFALGLAMGSLVAHKLRCALLRKT